MKLKSQLNNIIKDAFLKANIDHEAMSVSEATKAEFGDFQFNGAMALSKKLGKNPREIANIIIDNLDTTTIINKTQIAGPGFINIWIDNSWIARQCEDALDDTRLGVTSKKNPSRVVVDYSGPNMAKQMHVGHLRSTIIGDTISNLLIFLGDDVIRQNHIGDWGTQFGMLVAYLQEQNSDGTMSLKDLEQFYKDAKLRFDSDEAFANKARDYVVKIQGGDKHSLSLWQKFIDSSIEHCEEVYHKLNVKLTKDDIKAESFYNDSLKDIIQSLSNANLLQNSNGAKCVFIDGDDTPIIVQKSDGGYLYATTDLAALKYREQTIKADRIMYVVDARQSMHFRQIFKLAKDANFVAQKSALEHIAFGTMMNEDGKPFKTRDGGTIKLMDLLDEAVEKAKDTINDKELYSKDELDTLAKIIGIGAIKYADLSINRESNYIFNWDKMLSFEGNTSLYMQYGYARIQSIFRKYNQTVAGDIVINDDLEHRLGVMLLRFEDTLSRASIDASPNQITTYLYELTSLFMKFYEHNPILKDGIDKETKLSRLRLSDLTAKTIKKGLEILGIEVVDKL